MNKPVVFSDLDDTLFQTRRKMVDELDVQPFMVGAVDRSLQPRSFMTEEQSMLVNWMLECTDFIPVTARGTQEIQRVKIPFHSWKITTHGAVILTPEGQPDIDWQSHITASLAPYHDRLESMQHAITHMMEAQGMNAFARINYEYDNVPVYLVMKHRDSTQLSELYALHNTIKQTFPLTQFYIHSNSNNIAYIPIPVDKGLAVNWLLNKLRCERGRFPVIGLGDSLSDHRFMKLCSWFGMPRQSQFADEINHKIFGDA